VIFLETPFHGVTDCSLFTSPLGVPVSDEAGYRLLILASLV